MAPLTEPANRFWQKNTLDALASLARDHERLAARLPLPEPIENAGNTEGQYGIFPTVLADLDQGKDDFPRPITEPRGLHWPGLLRLITRVEKLGVITENACEKPSEPGNRCIDSFLEFHRKLLEVSDAARNLLHWSRVLPGTEAAHETLRTLLDDLRTGKLARDPNAEDWRSLREKFRARRTTKWDFLPPRAKGTILLPIRTDIPSSAFRKEIENALALHWNLSPWARARKLSFEIRWEIIPPSTLLLKDPRMSPEKLDAHLASFLNDRLAITTGAPLHFVRRNVLALGPHPIRSRTLAHEIGHLLGFADCYVRVLSRGGLLGQVVWEWDNPFFPDELMCDDRAGVARNLVWE